MIVELFREYYLFVALEPQWTVCIASGTIFGVLGAMISGRKDGLAERFLLAPLGSAAGIGIVYGVVLFLPLFVLLAPLRISAWLASRGHLRMVTKKDKPWLPRAKTLRRKRIC